MNHHYPFTESGYQARLVVGWTVLIAALLIVGFHPPTALGLLVVGGSIVGATLYAHGQNQIRRPGDGGGMTSRFHARGERIDQAREYRDLFEEGILSREEYHDAVARLYPEINRERSQANPRNQTR